MNFCPRSQSFLAIFIVTALGLFPTIISAASPVSLSFQQNTDKSSTEFITIDVTLASNDHVMNAIASSFSYSAEDLRVIDISVEDSFISWWIVEPTVDEELGIINFAGIVFFPGFQGEGTVFTVTFENTTKDENNLTWIDHWVLASDGKGTTLPSEATNISLGDIFSKDNR